MIKDIIEQAEALEQRIHTLSLTKEEMEANAEEIRRLDQERTQLLAQCADLSAADRVYLARHPKRPHIDDFIEHLFTDFFEQKGDHLYDDRSRSSQGPHDGREYPLQFRHAASGGLS